MKIRYLGIFLPAMLWLLMQLNSCGKPEERENPAKTSSRKTNDGSSNNAGSSDSDSSSSCSWTANTTETSTTNTYGCALLTRDVSSCKADRESQGLSGFWLKFSCNVTLTKDGSNVILSSKDIPDYKSYYYSTTDVCYQSFSSNIRKANPNRIAAQSITLTVPYEPSAASSTTATPEGVIGMALNGVAIYDNSAAPGDDIYEEEYTFDKCDGHPDTFSRYHYHTEPSAITNNDDNFIGILRDGFPVYGRKDYETGNVVTGLDDCGGKTGKTVDSTTASVYHYHTNLQSNGTESAYFISAGYYRGTPGSCTGCE